MNIGDTVTISMGRGTVLTTVVIGTGNGEDPKAQAMDRAVSAMQRQHKSDGKPSQWRPEF